MMQKTVVNNAIFNERSNTAGKIGSEKNLAKLDSVNCSVSTLFPCTVNAYSTIISIGTMIMANIHTTYGVMSLANDFISPYPIFLIT